MNNWRQRKCSFETIPLLQPRPVPHPTLASVAAYSSLPDLLAHLCWKLTKQNQDKVTDFGCVFGSYCSIKHSSYSPASNWANRTVTAALGRRSQFPSIHWPQHLPDWVTCFLLSAHSERWNPPHLTNVLGVGGKGKHRESNTGACTR